MQILLILGMLFCAIQAIRAARLLISVLWLAGISALLAIVLYSLDAYVVAAIELSVGAGLVTVLFVFAINIIGDEPVKTWPVVPRWLAAGLVIVSVLLLGWSVLPIIGIERPLAETAFAQMFWNERRLDALLQIALIFAGALGVLGLLAEDETRPDESAAHAEQIISESEPQAETKLLPDTPREEEFV